MTALTDLRDRVAAATGASRELDREIAIGLGVLKIDGASGRLYCEEADVSQVFGGINDDIFVRNYTQSVDAALALVKWLLPGWSHVIGTEEHHENGFKAEIWCSWGPTAYERHSAKAVRTEPLAILAALLSALTAQEQP